MNRLNVLARLFARTENPVIAQIHTLALNQPLFIEPALGELLVGAYMAGSVEYANEPRQQRADKIGVLNVSGALVSRPMPGPSGEGPANYEQMTAAFDAFVGDDSVGGIVLRMDSPGGVAAGLFDFTDRIFEARGTKPIHAVVDNIAYSAAFAIAAAADEIWISRTGGVGSVGVVAYHVDQSEANSQEGLKVTPIYAGAQKIEFSPHFPLTEEARERAQVEVDRLYSLFAESVAKYRGISGDAVRGTEAGLFHGPGAIDAKFADRVGTFAHALAHLSGGEVDDPTEDPQARAADEAATAEAQQRDAQRAVGVVTAAVMAADLSPALTKALLKANVAVEAIEDRIAHAKQVVEICELAKLADKAETFVAKHTPIDEVRAELLDKKADAQPEIITALPTGTGPAAGIPGLWDKTIMKFGGKVQ